MVLVRAHALWPSVLVALPPVRSRLYAAADHDHSDTDSRDTQCEMAEGTGPRKPRLAWHSGLT